MTPKQRSVNSKKFCERQVSVNGIYLTLTVVRVLAHFGHPTGSDVPVCM